LPTRGYDLVDEPKSCRHLLCNSGVGCGENDLPASGMLALRPGHEVVASRNTLDVRRALRGDELPPCCTPAHQPIENLEHGARVAPHQAQGTFVPQIGFEQSAVQIDHQRNLA
jgi:hypothetical protein